MEEGIKSLLALDPKFREIAAIYGNPNFVTRPQGFETLCKIILEQQVSLDSALAAFNKLKVLIGDFTPQNITEVTEQEFRNCGVSRQKASYMRGLAEAILDGSLDLEGLAYKDSAEIRTELLRLKGVGNWTVDIYMMFSLQSPDILPLGDIGIISAIKDVWGLQTMDEITAYAESWKPYRTAAAFFLWHYYLVKRGRVFPY